MIEVRAAQSGAPVVVQDGRALASLRDPVAEGERWASRAVERAGARFASAVALGAGSGYGVAALVRALGSERAVCLEPDQELVDAILRLAASGVAGLRGLEPGAFVAGRDLEATFSSPAVLRVTRRPFAIAITGAAAEREAGFHRAARERLIARSPDAFERELALRPELARSLSPGFPAAGDALLSVRDVRRALLPEAFGRERAVWSALEELTA